MTQSKTQSNPQIGGLAGWALAALQRSRATAAARRNARSLELLETLSLGGRKQIAVLSCDGRRFLIGMNADSITTMLPLDATEPTQPEQAQSSITKVSWEGGL